MGAYIREEKHFNLQSVKRTFLAFFQNTKTRISEYVKLTIKLKIKTPLMSFWPLYC